MARGKSKGFSKRGNRYQVDTTYRGIRIREAVATPEMAEKVIRKAKTLIDEDRYLEKKRKANITLSQLAKRYIQWCKTEGQKAVKDKERRLTRMVARLGPDLPLSKLGPTDLEAFKEQRMSEKGPSGRPIKPATVNRPLAYFRHMLTKAVDWGLLESNPARKVKQLKEPKHRIRYLSSAELQALTEAADPYMRAVIVVAVNTGLRFGELMGLRWADVSFKTGLIEIPVQKNDEIGHVPMNATVRRLLRRFPRRIDSPYVFAKANGKPPVDFRRKFQKIRKKAKVGHCRFHDTRHTFASHLAMSGVDLLTIKKLMRHKTMAMTLRYAHLSDQHTKSAVERLSFEEPRDERKEAL